METDSQHLEPINIFSNNENLLEFIIISVEVLILFSAGLYYIPNCYVEANISFLLQYIYSITLIMSYFADSD